MAYSDDYAAELLEKVERQIKELYGMASDQIAQIIKEYWYGGEHHHSLAYRASQMQARVDAGLMSQTEFQLWMQNQIARGQRWEELQARIAEVMADTNQYAMAYINDVIPEVYAIAHNYDTFEVDQFAPSGTFTFLNHETIRNLMVNNPTLMPYFPLERALEYGYDLRYFSEVLHRHITSGIIRGNDIPTLAQNLMNDIPNMGLVSAIRAARTATTSAFNAGKMESMAEAEEQGIHMRKRWDSVLDTRVRDSHQMLDGTIVNWDEKFTNGLEFPGDPNGAPGEVYNCRCKMHRLLPNRHYANVRRAKLEDGSYVLVRDMNYQQWAESMKQADPDGWKIYQDMGKYRSRDMSEWKEMRDAIGSNAPSSFWSFQQIRYNDPEEFARLRAMEKKHGT